MSVSNSNIPEGAIFLDEYLYGNGIFLDENFDFEVDNTGDIKASTGTDELEKDLAFQMAITLGRLIGQPPSPSTEIKIINRATSVALADNRIDSVNEDAIELRKIELNNRDVEYELILPVNASDQKQQLVFIL